MIGETAAINSPAPSAGLYTIHATEMTVNATESEKNALLDTVTPWETAFFKIGRWDTGIISC